jgi:RNA polymerase sigma factor (sigma-70 family)
MGDIVSSLPLEDSRALESDPLTPGRDATLLTSAVPWEEMYRQACSFVNNPADAEDIAQDAYVQIFERVSNVPNGRKIESVLGWVRGIVRHLVLHRFHEYRPDLHETIEEDGDDCISILETLADQRPSIEDQLVRDALIKASLRVLGDLPELDRQCVLMYARGYTFVQISKSLGITYKVALNTTRRAVQKARERIRF